MISFDRASGNIAINDACVGWGYSGAPGHVGVVADEQLHGLGPLPAGRYLICNPIANHLGPDSMPLTPDPATRMYGRGSFFIHADNHEKPPQSSSEGCIVTGPDVRKLIEAQLAIDATLVVT